VGFGSPFLKRFLVEQFEIPHLIEATSFKMLQKKMLQVNVRLGGKVIYNVLKPSYKGDSWSAIYYERVNAAEHLKKQLEGVE
jgi:hypothetical protein